MFPRSHLTSHLVTIFVHIRCGFLVVCVIHARICLGSSFYIWLRATVVCNLFELENIACEILMSLQTFPTAKRGECINCLCKTYTRDSVRLSYRMSAALCSEMCMQCMRTCVCVVRTRNYSPNRARHNLFTYAAPPRAPFSLHAREHVSRTCRAINKTQSISATSAAGAVCVVCLRLDAQARGRVFGTK